MRAKLGGGLAAGAALIGMVMAGGGCALSGTSFFTQEFLDALSLTGGNVTPIPGEAPALLVVAENRTSRTVECLVSWRDGDGAVNQRIIVLAPGAKQAEAVICPVEALTMGDVSNLTSTGAVVRLGSGSPNDPIVEVEAFGVLLRDGANYDCGDRVTFAIQQASGNLSGYGIVAYIQRSGL
ncbi:MAG: hypothetical protein LC135_14295 [Phycisphaerae bacterium]|jgi:hypothetical protein|nr:hypothetical protein [Phycisphaerae bacterium]MCZ2401020.1 hypothetical protein [Phycisphaerae bacterium]